MAHPYEQPARVPRRVSFLARDATRGRWHASILLIMRRLREVKSFGAIAAEDDDLRKYFVRTPVYEDIKQGDCQFVIGRKGSGKSALYLSLLQDPDLSSSRGLSFDDYPWGLHYKYSASLGDKQERFLASWRFLIFLEAFKLILTDAKRSSRYQTKEQRESLKAVEKFITDNWGVVAFDFKKTFPGTGYKLEGMQLAPQAFGFGLGGVNVSRGSEGLGDSLSRLNEWLWECLKVLGGQIPTIHLLFDELDKGFDPHSEDYLERQIGLLLAVRNTRRDFARAGLSIFPVVFLRTDIFDALHFGDKNKLFDKNAQFLRWNDDLDTIHDCSLKQLIDHRIQEEMELPSDTKDPWSAVFDPKVMRGTQHKFHHMSFRSYLRPRDIIKFANCALNEARNRLRKSPDSVELIISDDIRKARREYSSYLLRELDDEINASYPGWDRYLEVLRKIGTERFTRSAFSSAFERLKDTMGFSMPEDAVMKMFYEYSIVGFERVRPGGSGYYVHFRYMDEKVHLDMTSKMFQVHRGLKQGLGLVEGDED